MKKNTLIEQNKKTELDRIKRDRDNLHGLFLYLSGLCDGQHHLQPLGTEVLQTLLSVMKILDGLTTEGERRKR